MLQRIYQQAERTKNILSTNKAANVFVENLYKGFDFQTRITRESFERKPLLLSGFFQPNFLFTFNYC